MQPVFSDQKEFKSKRMTKTGNARIDWRIGGPQGSGIDRIATLFARACAASGQEIVCRREYHSNIKGRHSYCDVSSSPEAVTSHSESPQMLVTFEPEALCRHLDSLTTPGYLVCSGDDRDVDLGSLGYLEPRILQKRLAQLEAMELPPTAGGLMQMAHGQGIQLFPVPYKALLASLADELGLKHQRVAAVINTIAVAVSASLLGVSRDILEQALEKIFPGQEDVLMINRRAIGIACAFVQDRFSPIELQLTATGGSTASRLLLNATQSVALGKLAAGLGFQSYYPISPASDESFFLEAHDRVSLVNGGESGAVLFQAEDEIAAVAMACGAALTGARSATATSGPGFSLMTEGLGWAGMNEVPLVVTLYQRGGPSTGMPTRTDQGDLLSAIHGGHGEYPRMVIASADIESCFYDAARAFDYAERYQMPVVHLLDKALTSTLQTVPAFETGGLRIDRGLRYEPADHSGQAALRFALTQSGISPRPLLGQAGGHHWLTGVEHTQEGQVTEDPVLREQMMEKRARKLLHAERDIPPAEKLEILGDAKAALTMITWGSNKGAVLEALKRLQEEGISARAVQLRLLWPFPVRELETIIATAAPLVAVECNYSGQMNELLEAQSGRGCDHLVVKYSGRPISGKSLYRALQQIHAGHAEARIVLRNPDE
ncbi:MAG: 2-oxoacid:acceptor oxidoreductase subunit alpha [Gammaproteobacteria bacterium]